VVKGRKDQAVSERLPVARVAVDISLAHLDRPFDYLVPVSMDEAAGPGEPDDPEDPQPASGTARTTSATAGTNSVLRRVRLIVSLRPMDAPPSRRQHSERS